MKAMSESSTPITQESNQMETGNENKKCLVMAITGKKRVIAEGRWSTNDPLQTVHFVPLGPNAVKVWIDVVKVKDACVWRPSSEIECMEDAIGTTIAWPEDKVVLV
ncbi:uncharacterized protein LOC112089853 [Eutrema salsugineum]|uniref:uncharacterized protein LOC112089853 n=1 Tax=Eutrema salsugineum TaxID=72664 RepID=UPI000CED725F|nr:uncharacterized protein LOC112089853 [Eutrema salsugineum]